jgi:hypothetical protein
MDATVLNRINEIFGYENEDIELGLILPAEGANTAMDILFQEGLIWELLKEYAQDHPYLLKGIKAVQTNQPHARIKDL